jgi:hypothetical protein
MTLKPGEGTYNPRTGRQYGPSLNTDPNSPSIVNNGGANQITSIPDELVIKQTSPTKTSPHVEIVPKDPTMPPEQFQKLLNQVGFGKQSR